MLHNYNGEIKEMNFNTDIYSASEQKIKSE